VIILGATRLDAVLKEIPPSLEGLGLTQAQIAGTKTRFVLGHNILIDPDSLQDLTTFGEDFITQPTSLTKMEVLSSSIEDDVGLTGATKIEIHGLGTNFDEKSQTVIMNGTTVVTTDELGADIEFIKVNHVQVLAPAPTNSNHTTVGTILVRGLSGGITFGNIESGNNMELAARATIPNGFTAFIPRWNASAGKVPASGDEILFLLRASVDAIQRTLLTNVFVFQDVMHLASNSNYADFSPVLSFPSKCEIKISSKLNGNGTAVASASFQYWLVPNG